MEGFHQAIIGAHEGEKEKRESKPEHQEKLQAEPGDGSSTVSEDDDVIQQEAPSHQGKLILDAAVGEQAIRYPADLSLLNEAREFSEQIIDILYPYTPLAKKPRTYREKARKAFLAIVKQRRPGGKMRRRGLKQQLQYLRRNLGHIEQLLTFWPEGTELPLSRGLLYRYWVIQHLYDQQWDMYHTKTRRCDDRIVSISQPYVRPILRGKQNKPLDFPLALLPTLSPR